MPTVKITIFKYIHLKYAEMNKVVIYLVSRKEMHVLIAVVFKHRKVFFPPFLEKSFA